MNAACPTARPLRHWDDAVLAHLQRRLDTAWSAWCGDWDVACGPVTCSNATPSTSEAAVAWHLIGYGPGEEPVLWFAGPAADPAAGLHRLLFGGVPTAGQRARECSPVAAAVSAAAWDQLRQQVCRGMAAALASPTADGTHRPIPAHSWSGAVLATLQAGDEDAAPLFLHLASDLVATLAAPWRATPNRPAPPLTTLAEALRERVIGLEVALLGAELDLASIQTLQPGDVVLLQHPLDEPLPLQLQACAGHEPVAFGQLGCRGSSKAVTLLADPRQAVERPAVSSLANHRIPR